MSLRLYALEKEVEGVRQNIHEDISAIHNRVGNVENGERNNGGSRQRLDMSTLQYKVKTQPKSYDQAFKDKIGRDIEDLREMFKNDIEKVSIDIDSINKDLYQINRDKISEIVSGVKVSDVKSRESRHKTKSLKRANVEDLLRQDIVIDEKRGISAHNDYRIREYKEPALKSILAKAGHKVVFGGVSEINEGHGHSGLGSDRSRHGSRSRSGLKSIDRNRPISGDRNMSQSSDRNRPLVSDRNRPIVSDRSRPMVSDRNRPRSSDSRTFKTSSLCVKTKDKERKRRYSPDRESSRGSNVYRELYNGYSLGIRNGSQLRPIIECAYCTEDNDNMCNCREKRRQKYRSRSPFISTSAPLISRNTVPSMKTTTSDPQNPQNPFTSNPSEEFVTGKSDQSSKPSISYKKANPKDFVSDEVVEFSLSGY
jgi:hypothetical protein